MGVHDALPPVDGINLPTCQSVPVHVVEKVDEGQDSYSEVLVEVRTEQTHLCRAAGRHTHDSVEWSIHKNRSTVMWTAASRDYVPNPQILLKVSFPNSKLPPALLFIKLITVAVKTIFSSGERVCVSTLVWLYFCSGGGEVKTAMSVEIGESCSA